MNWENSGPLKSAGEQSFNRIYGATEFHDAFGPEHIVNAYLQYLETYGESFEETIEELDEQDTYNARYYEGCVEAIDVIVGNRNHGSFDSIVEACDFVLKDIDEQSKAINKQNDYWRRYFDGQVQTLTEIKKQAEKWDEIMGWVEAFGND